MYNISPPLELHTHLAGRSSVYYKTTITTKTADALSSAWHAHLAGHSSVYYLLLNRQPPRPKQRASFKSHLAVSREDGGIHAPEQRPPLAAVLAPHPLGLRRRLALTAGRHGRGQLRLGLFRAPVNRKE